MDEILAIETDINVQNVDLTITNTGRMVTTSLCIIRRGKQKVILYEYDQVRKLMMSYKSDKILINIYNQNKVSSVSLPPTIQRRLVEYLAKRYTRDESQSRDCTDFVMYILGVPGVKYLHYDDYRSGGPYAFVSLGLLENEKDLAVGTVVLLLTNKIANYEFRHFMLYIGNNLYLSKIQTGGGLQITDLDSMLRLYKADSVFPIIDVIDRNSDYQNYNRNQSLIPDRISNNLSPPFAKFVQYYIYDGCRMHYMLNHE